MINNVGLVKLLIILQSQVFPRTCKFDKSLKQVWNFCLESPLLIEQKLRCFEIDSCLNLKLIIPALFKEASGQSNVL